MGHGCFLVGCGDQSRTFSMKAANAASMEQASLTQRVAKLEKDLKKEAARAERAEQARLN